jgi:hypothetical protein
MPELERIDLLEGSSSGWGEVPENRVNSENELSLSGFEGRDREECVMLAELFVLMAIRNRLMNDRLSKQPRSEQYLRQLVVIGWRVKLHACHYRCVEISTTPHKDTFTTLEPQNKQYLLGTICDEKLQLSRNNKCNVQKPTKSALHFPLASQD